MTSYEPGTLDWVRTAQLLDDVTYVQTMDTLSRYHQISQKSLHLLDDVLYVHNLTNLFIIPVFRCNVFCYRIYIYSHIYLPACRLLSLGDNYL